MTTVHLGDCLNGCATCANNYHAQFAGETCDTCNIEQEAFACGACGEWSHPNSHNCSEEQRFSCCSCGYQFFQNEGVTIEEGRHLEFVCSECYGGNN